MKPSISELINDVSSLVSPPKVASRIAALLAEEDTTTSQIAELIEQDPALSAKLLKIANSALYSGGREIDSVRKALTRLGSKQLNELVMGIEVSKSFSTLPNAFISLEDFWKHCLYCAVIAKKVADHCRCCDPGAAFTGGLLHDIGQLAIFSRLTDETSEVLNESLEDYDGIVTHQAEKDVLGFDHTDVGVALAKQWGLPSSLQDCIYAHHELDKLDSVSNMVLVVHLANSLAILAELQTDDFSNAPAIDDRVWDTLSLTRDDCLRFIEDSLEETASLLSDFSS
ncbi:MAG: HDOD domain-containing protein [Spongiibacteraceae bacterium]